MTLLFLLVTIPTLIWWFVFELKENQRLNQRWKEERQFLRERGKL